MDKTFKYDIAFSFLSQDESIAQQINDALQERFQTFLYSERQKELAGTDGEETFKRVFAKEARIVAVLYRPEWGSTSWTRIEQTAIRDRAHDDGYDFCTFIAMTDPIERPNWLPKNRLLYGLKRFGVSGAATALEARIQEQGGVISEETVTQRGQRLKRAQQFAAEVEHFLSTEMGVTAANAAVLDIVQRITQYAADLKKTGLNFDVRELAWGNHVVRSPNAVLVFYWQSHYANSLNGAKLDVGFYDKIPKMPGVMVFDEAKRLEHITFEFKLIAADRPAWVHRETEVAPEDMADFLMKTLMRHSEMELRRKQR